jgi:hypothetical protein
MKVLALYPLAFLISAALSVAAQDLPVSQPAEAAPRYPNSGIFADKGQAAIPAGEVPAPTPQKAVADYHPLTSRQKFLLSTKESFGPAVLVFDAASAGYDQVTNTPGPWGQGGQAYAERFASEFGITMIDQYSRFALESALHEDPRYFLSPDRSYGARIKSAIKQTLIHKTDSGGQRFAFANFGGALAAGFASNAWLPNTNNSAGDALETASLLIGRDLAVNLAIEFIPLFRRIH